MLHSTVLACCSTKLRSWAQLMWLHMQCSTYESMGRASVMCTCWLGEDLCRCVHFKVLCAGVCKCHLFLKHFKCIVPSALRLHTHPPITITTPPHASQAACTPKELRELTGLLSVSTHAPPDQMEVSASDQAEMKATRMRRRVYDLIKQVCVCLCVMREREREQFII